MATKIDSVPSPPREPTGKLVEYEEYIEAQLRKTRGHVRSVDIAGSLMTLCAGTVAYFFLAAIVDHWIVPGGLGFWGRLTILSLYVLASLYFLFVEVLPLLVRRINPVYAAQTIERSRPSLKNALVNFLFFRDNPAGLNQAMYEAIEEQAATHLAKEHVEVAVDRTKMIRIGYALIGMVSVCALYALLSPKDLFKTVGRVVMPWAEIGAPTRAMIDEVEPGDTRAFRGQQVVVSARVQGVPSDGKVTLFYTTSDGQTVDRAVDMPLAADGYKHACTLPAGESSLQQSLEYRIEAGDAVTKWYHLEVVAAPTLVVRSLEYKYPAYTGLLTQRVEHQGDLKALEGTEVTLDAIANQSIESAHVDFDCDKTLDQRMQIDGQQAKATFRLKLKDDRKTPEHASYELVFKNDQGQQNPQPVRHQIDVVRDLSPEIQFVTPKKDDVDLPVNQAIELEIVANDPDFALRLVKLSATAGKQPLMDKMLLDEVWRGQWVKKFRIEPLKLGLKAGDVIEYSAAAEDNKNPQPNRTETAKRRIRIVSPSAQDRNQDQLTQKNSQGEGQGQAGDEGQRGGDDEHLRDKNYNQAGQKEPQADPAKPDKRDEAGPQDAGQKDGQQQNDGQAEQGAGQKQTEQGQQAAGKPGAGEQKGDKLGQQGAGQSVPNDGSDDGDAFEQILKRREEQTKKSNPKAGDQKPTGPRQQQQDEQKSDDKQASDQQQPGEKQGQDRQQKPSDTKKQPEGERGEGSKAGDKQRQPQAAKEGGSDKKSDAAGEQDEQGADQPKEKAGEKSSREQPEKSDRSQEPGSPQGNEKGDGSSGAGDAGGQQQDQNGQQGGKGQQKKGLSGDKGQKGQGQSSADNAPTQGSSGRGGQGNDGKSASKPGGSDSRSGEPKNGDKASSDKADGAAEDGRQKGQGTQTKNPAANKKPVANDKADGEESGPSGSSKPDGKSDSRGKSQAEKPQGEKQSPTNADPAAQNTDGANSGEKPDGKADKSQAKPAKRSTDKSDQATPDESDPAGNAKDGQGVQSKGDTSRDASRKSSHDKKTPDVQQSAEEKEKGESGAGQAGQDNKGSPSPQRDQQPSKKSPSNKPDEKDPKNDSGQPQSPSTSERESNSEGIDDGDRSGGGKKGGGQKANKSGTGGPGQNTAADEGAGRSDEAGKGETSNRAGSDREANKKTGQGGSKPGEGSDSKSSQGDKPGGGAPRESSSAGQEGQSASGDQQTQPGGQSGGGQPNGGKPSDGSPADQKWKPGQDEAEEANLQYARKATDLALEHLKDELRKDQPDPELLKRLGWTKKDLENFVKRWEQMRKQAQGPDEKGKTAQRELDESLRSLGLRPRSTSLKSNSARDDQTRGLKESRRTSPPAEYSEQYKSYIQGTAKGGK